MLTATLVASTLLASSLAGTPSTATAEEVLRASDHKKIAKLVAEYWNATTEVKGIQAAFDKLLSTVQSIDEKMDDGMPLLAAVEDWRQIFWLATEEGLDKPKAGKVTTNSDASPAFTYYVDRRYKSTKGPFPMFLIVADEGQSAEEALALWDDEGLRGTAILAAFALEGEAKDWTGEAGFLGVMRAFSRVARSNQFGFDYNQVFLAGNGKGFAAAAATAGAYSQLFAGLIGRGEIPEVDPKNFMNLPTWASSGMGAADALHGKVQELGYENCTLGDDSSTAVWEWAQAQRRDAYPNHISFWPPNGLARGTHWVGVDGLNLDGAPHLDAVVDRDTNTITITAEDIASVRLSLNDVLVDLSQPVQVIINGVAHEEVGPRNRKSMVDGVYSQGDWGRVFTRVTSYDVPEPSQE